MEVEDLDIDNYTLDDILSLFKLDPILTAESIKSARKIAYMTHPDRSSLPPKYFIFFMDAYKLLACLYSFQNRQQRPKDGFSLAYDPTVGSDDENAVYLHALQGKSIKEFNIWFNEMFEKVKLHDGESDSGYGDWYKQKETEQSSGKLTKTQFDGVFLRKKEECRALRKNMDVIGTAGNVGYNLARTGVDSYASSIFSRLQYEDLKKAHTETVVPVTKEDFDTKPTYASAAQLERERQKDISPLSLQQAQKYLAETARRHGKQETRRVYDIIKRNEQLDKNNKKWWSHLKQLTDE